MAIEFEINHETGLRLWWYIGIVRPADIINQITKNAVDPDYRRHQLYFGLAKCKMK